MSPPPAPAPWKSGDHGDDGDGDDDGDDILTLIFRVTHYVESSRRESCRGEDKSDADRAEDQVGWSGVEQRIV
jgi:hypothetical protein